MNLKYLYCYNIKKDLSMKFWFLPLALLLGCATAPSSQGLSGNINIDVKEIKLKNGLTALLVQNPKLPIFSLQLFYKVGGKNETPGITGASHFLEHMMFKGAKKYGKNTIDFIIEGSGGSTNAYTTNDQTVYHENLPASELERILDIEADRMENLLLDEDDFNKERLVVLEERKMRYENSPRGQLYLELMQNLFSGTPYGRSVIGDIADLKTVTREQIFNYFKRFYAPNNATLVLVGDFDLNRATQLIQEKFGKIPSSAAVENAHAQLKDEDFQPIISKEKIVAKKGESPSPLFMMGFPTYKAGHPKGYALDVLSSIIGSGKSSSLVNQYILIDRPMATSIYAAHQSLDKSGFFFIGGALVQGVKLDQFRQDLQQKLKSYCGQEITERNIQKVKNNYLTQLYAGLDTNLGLGQFLGERQITFGDWRYYKQELELYEQVSVEDVRSACVDVFSRPGVFVSVWNKHQG
jgi:zinc protease